MRSRVLRTARTYLGCKYLHQGRSREGLDCVGLPVLVARDIGLSHVDEIRYSRNPSPRKLLESLSASCDRLSASDPTRLSPDVDAWSLSQPGDLIVFWFQAPHLPQHVGFRSERGILHTWSGVLRVVEHGATEDWLSRVHSVWFYRS